MHGHSFSAFFRSSDLKNTATIHGSSSEALLRNYHRLQVPFTSMEILWTRNSCFQQFIPWIRSASTRPSRIGVINSVWVWQKKKKDESVFLWTIRFWPWWNRKKWNCWYLLRLRHLETGCKEACWASNHWNRRYRWHNDVKKPSSSIFS